MDVTLRALLLVLGDPHSSITPGSGVTSVLYRWPCGCNAVCADGVKCTELDWCTQHEGSLQ